MSHADEARALAVKVYALMPEDKGNVATGMIAAALAAAERRGIERAADIITDARENSCPHRIDESCCIDALRNVDVAIRALLPAEPAAKCATCETPAVAGHEREYLGDDGFWRPCPSCGGAR